MGMLCLENPPNSSKRCRVFCSVLKDAFSLCHPCKRRSMSFPSAEEENPFSDFDDLQEEIVSMIKERAMEAKLRRKSTTSYKQEDGDDDQEAPPEEFMSVQSHFSVCSACASAVDSENFLSVKTDFSQYCSSSSGKEIVEFGERKWWAWEGYLDSDELRRREIIQEVLHCEGWPFGLCRKVLLLPPLPKSPSESWTWCKGAAKIVKTF